MGGATRFLMLLSTTTTPFPLLRLSCFRHCHRLPLFSSSSFSYRHYHHHHHHNHRISPSRHHPIKATKDDDFHAYATTSHFSSCPPPPAASHPWPEWCGLIRSLDAGGYFSREGFRYASDELVSINELPEEFVREVNACLAFAHDRPEALGMVSRRDIEVVVENGMPFLFKNGDDTVRRMRMFLDRGGESDAPNDDRAYTIDLIRFLLSYASNPRCFEETNVHNGELVVSSVRNLLNEFSRISFAASPSNIPQMVQHRFPGVVEQRPRTFRQDIEMKRGDWICPRCSFMNFAKNVKCLECEEARPKRQLTGGEWECPQCDFFNYGRNKECLRCDCKRPGLDGSNSRLGLGYSNTSDPNSAYIDSRLAANEEKAQRWFSKVSQLDSTADIGSAIADEDFPEIMPLRKGVNRFVVSTRKTPLERRLANAQYQRNLGNDGYREGSNPQAQNINRTLDDILGRKAGSSESGNSINSPQNARMNTSVSDSTSHAPSTTNSNYVPFVPLPPDMFANKSAESKVEGSETGQTNRPFASSNAEQIGDGYGKSEFVKSGENWQSTDKPVDEAVSSNEENGDEKSDSWFKRIAELHNVKEEDIAAPSEDFPEVMPMRKGENRFVVGKKKDRSLTSPINKRRMAMEQANNTNFVPFVPFPPDYFAKKDDKQTATDSTHAATGPSMPNELSGKQDDNRVVTGTPAIEHQHYDSRSFNSRPSGGSSAAASTRSADGTPMNGNLTSNESMNNKYSAKGDNRGNATVTGSTFQLSQNQNNSSGWNEKSLEGSAVKEVDPLDMSEEAKAERWFRRVAQIKDISELSQIPDEDFPSIMPMRKGVNRFVVSKRKTPLERRLTSAKYRRNLPTVSSDPLKENNNS